MPATAGSGSITSPGPDDELALALENGRLRRNFMGYVVDPAPHLLAFGTSGIGEVAGRYAQNDAHLGGYQRSVDGGALPIIRGHLLSADDRLRRAAIDRLLCTLELPYRDLPHQGEAGNVLAPFRAFVEDGLVDFEREPPHGDAGRAVLPPQPRAGAGCLRRRRRPPPLLAHRS